MLAAHEAPCLTAEVWPRFLLWPCFGRGALHKERQMPLCYAVAPDGRLMTV